MAIYILYQCIISSDNSCLVLISDAAKLESKLEELTVYAALHSSAALTVKFHINPVSDYKIYWSIGDTEVQHSVISNTENGRHVETTYSILDVTESQLGNYTVQVINQAIKREPNNATFTVVLELRGQNIKVIYVYATATYQYLHIISLGTLLRLNQLKQEFSQI